jgi:DNA replication protein DnaC
MAMKMIEMERALKQLRLSGIRATLETRVLEAKSSKLDFMDVFSSLIQDELDRRQSSTSERRYKFSGLPEKKSYDEFDWNFNPKIPKKSCFELLTTKFITEGLCPILIGPPGTGKSHIAKSVAYKAIRDGYVVIYGEDEDLLTKISVTTDVARKKIMKQIIDCDLVVFDDLFLNRKLSDELSQILQVILHKRYKMRRSTLITSNRIIRDWNQFLGDNAMASTLHDRLLHRGIPLQFEGKSYRLNEAAERLAKGGTKQ